MVGGILGAGLGGWWLGAHPPEWAPGGGQGGPAMKASAPASGANAPGGPQAGPGGERARRFGGNKQVQPVTVGLVKAQDVHVVLGAIGNISALNTAVVRSRVDGELKTIRFKEGQSVKAGALLAEIDPRALEIQLAQAQGQLARDQAQLKNAQLDLERYKDLLAKDSIPKQQLDTQEATVRQLVGTVQIDQALVDNAKLQLSYTKITAPVSGQLGLKTAELGSLVRAGDAAGIVSITQTQPIGVVFSVPEVNLPQIKRKLQRGDPLVVEAWDREQRSMLARGKVIATENAIDPLTGTIKLKAEFANDQGALFPNQFVNIRLLVNVLEGSLTVPGAAIQRGSQGTYVYVVKPDNTVAMRRVQLGTTEGDVVSVQGELQADDKVVTDGADRLRDSSQVEVITPPKSGGPQRREKPNEVPGATPRANAQPASGTTSATLPATKSLAAPAIPASAGAVNGSKPDPAAWIDQLPPEVQERVRRMTEKMSPQEVEALGKMGPEERRAYFQKLRAQREQASGQ